jgi:hypothetical protein
MSFGLIDVHSSPTRPLSNRLRGIETVKIFHCYYSRNAWYSTRITRYAPGSMHLTREAAEAFSESERINGSVQFIEELPALHFRGEDFSLVVTQINTSDPLRDYVIAPKQRSVREGERRSYFTFGASLEEIARSFGPATRFWKKPQSDKDSVVALIMINSEQTTPLEASHRLGRWRAQSHGPDYFLEWHSHPCDTRGTAIAALAKESGFGAAVELAAQTKRPQPVEGGPSDAARR